MPGASVYRNCTPANFSQLTTALAGLSRMTDGRRQDNSISTLTIQLTLAKLPHGCYIIRALDTDKLFTSYQSNFHHTHTTLRNIRRIATETWETWQFIFARLARKPVTRTTKQLISRIDKDIIDYRSVLKAFPEQN